MGSRNNLRGPGFFDMDLGLGKTFPIYPGEGVNLKFRCDAFNAFNHPNFQTPSFENNMDLINPPNEFGTIPGTVTPTGAISLPEYCRARCGWSFRAAQVSNTDVAKAKWVFP